MTVQQTYVYLSIAIGLLQIYDGYKVYIDRGRISTFAVTFSMFEYIWAGISIYVIYKYWGLSISEVWYPMLFVLFVTVMATWGVLVYKDYDATSGELPVLSPSMVISGGAFGALFTVCGVYQAMAVG